MFATCLPLFRRVFAVCLPCVRRAWRVRRVRHIWRVRLFWACFSVLAVYSRCVRGVFAACSSRVCCVWRCRLIRRVRCVRHIRRARHVERVSACSSLLACVRRVLAVCAPCDHVYTACSPFARRGVFVTFGSFDMFGVFHLLGACSVIAMCSPCARRVLSVRHVRQVRRVWRVRHFLRVLPRVRRVLAACAPGAIGCCAQGAFGIFGVCSRFLSNLAVPLAGCAAARTRRHAQRLGVAMGAGGGAASQRYSNIVEKSGCLDASCLQCHWRANEFKKCESQRFNPLGQKTFIVTAIVMIGHPQH